MNELPPLLALKAFEVVYRTGGVRAAARELGITHSSISRHIGELEAWLGTSLFNRSGGRRSMELTPAGQQLGVTANDAFRDIARTASSVRQQKRRNDIVVSIAQSFATRWLLPRLHLFKEQFPNIDISVRVDQRITDFKDDPADLALRMGREKGSDGEAIPLMDDVIFPVISPQLKVQYQYLPPEHILRRFPLLHDLDPDVSWAAWKEKFGPEDLDVDKGPQITSSDLILRAAVLKQGVALARAVLANEDLENDMLSRISDQQIYIVDAYWLVLPQNRKRSIYLDQFIDWVKAEAEHSNHDLVAKYSFMA